MSQLRVKQSFTLSVTAGAYAPERLQIGRPNANTGPIPLKEIAVLVEAALSGGSLELWFLKNGGDPAVDTDYLSGPTILNLPNVFGVTQVGGFDTFQVRAKSAGTAGTLVVVVNGESLA